MACESEPPLSVGRFRIGRQEGTCARENSLQGFWGKAATHVLVYFVVGCIENVRMHVLLLTISFFVRLSSSAPPWGWGTASGGPDRRGGAPHRRIR